MKRVVITGMGLMTSIGNNLTTSWANLIAGKSGLKKIPESLFDTNDLASKIAGYIPTKEEDPILGFLPSDYGIEGMNARSMDRFIMLAIAAASEAFSDANLIIDSPGIANRSGVLMGAGIGGLLCIENNARILFEQGAKRISPFFIPASLINLSSGHISIRHNLKGPNCSTVTACASSSHAIGEAARMIICDDADVMVCGGSEAAICRLGMAGFIAARTLSTHYNDAPEKSSRPWDKGRDGFVMGEGAGVMILEEYEHAKKRGAKIYAELVGYGLTGDAYHITTPDPQGDGGFRAMQNALKKAGLTNEDVDYINAHGTSTPVGDMIEYRAIEKLFGNNKNVAISSTKSAIGHLLGGAGAVEAVFSVLAIRDGVVPPTLNLEDPEDECKMNLVPLKAQEKKVNVSLSNSFGFGGTNASLIFKKI